MPATFGDVYQKLCERYPDPRERGRQFEPLVARVLRTDRQYADRYAEVWRWSEWPGRRSADIGIDIVARRHDGGLAAIQCKCYDPSSTLYEQDLATFLANTNADFDERVIVSTTSSWSRNLLALISNQQPPVQRVNLFGLEENAINWDAYLEDEAAPLKPRARKELRPHQRQALTDVLSGFEEHDRGKLIMACGTGKTFTALRIAEEVAGPGGRVLFAAPSISLVAQALREWAADATTPIRAFAVCSDQKVGSRDGDGAQTYDLPIAATTDPGRLAQAAAPDAPDRLTVVFSTYQSMDVIRQAQDAGMPAFDITVCDEAHRTTGYALKDEERSSFLMVHDAEAVRARKRLYMTATPRLYSPAARKKAEAADAYVATMDDEETYGPELHRLNFADSVERDLLSDYKVAILVMSEEQVAREYQAELADGDGLKVGDVGRVVGCLNGLAKLDPGGTQFANDPRPMHSAVAFSNTIKDSRRFVDLVEALQDDEGREQRGIQVEAEHVDGKSGVLVRAERLAWLGAETMVMEAQCRVLSNARCLTEGIDVPALDAVLFLQPRKSQIDVVQAVGRVMRKAEGKHYGYIILPVVVPAGDDPSSALDRNAAYAHVWEVLQALRSHDERFDAWVNKLDLNRDRDGGPVSVIGVGPRAGTEDDEQSGTGVTEQASQYLLSGLDDRIERWRDAIYAKIVERCGERRYWEQWAESVGDIARRHHARIRALIEAPDSGVGERFEEFVAALRNNLNDSISDDDAAGMLSQHLITRPVFDALFGNSEFTSRNPVSQVMQGVLSELEDKGLESETEELEGFYASVRRRVEGIDNAEGRQRVAIELYDNFFRKAFPRDAERLGIVYTPIEIVDFIIRSVADLLREHFGASLGDEGVHILDPFTGTGTFIVRLIQSGLIDADDLPHKYRHELHANEILLLAYYIAGVNIESAYREALSDAGREDAYEPFGGIVLTDTFQLSELDNPMDDVFFPRNNARAERQRDLDIRVILGNPPWSRLQRAQSDLNPNQPYPTLDAAIEATYAGPSRAGSKAPLYDAYVRGIRWASNRVLDSEDGGIVAFVTNGSFIDAASFDGFRKAAAKEFHEIWVYNLRGAARGSGEVRQREKGNVFEGGTRTTVAVVFLVKRAAAVTKPAAIRYRDIGDYLSREQKLETVWGSHLLDVEWGELDPNEAGDWINQRSERFAALRPLALVESQPPGDAPLFGMSTLGLISNRDTWVFQSSATALRGQIEQTAAFFNEQVRGFTPPSGPARERLAAARAYATRDDTRFRWAVSAEERLSRGREVRVTEGGYRLAMYRPFFRQHLYMDRALNHRVHQLPNVFPPGHQHVPGLFAVQAGRADEVGVLATDTIPDASITSIERGRFFPRFLPDNLEESAPDQSAFRWGGPTSDRRDNINPEALAAYRARLDGGVTADQLFAYIYAVLHSPEYRERYSADLKRLLPRIPDPADRATFEAFAEAGQQLFDLHIGYEDVEPYPLDEEVALGAPPEPECFRVEKMRWGGQARKPDLSRIIYNEWITLAGIPDEAHEYIVGPRSALAWLIDRYQVKTDKASGIVNDVNDWGLELGESRYILDLVKRIVTVSVETVRIVRGLPELKEAD
ncbi:MAG: DEAD/DEAH box helicase [Gemmatimonadales bacterium]|nr:DEAD/DEAH box helicase [Gemmatimonadales bacterium]